ncbi:hypothetical protein G9A89_022779 [Geosiphon pyriformis]|nr:hypothetical protein G9A89_022779 [Geosiphon pyriformis]
MKLRFQETTDKLQQLGLNSNHYPAESAFNFYINNKITECLGGTVNIKAARENFYTELFQHTNLPKNYSFTPIIREINQTIERYTQQQFPITYVDKSKRKLQTPAVTPKEIQLPTWKKQRIESPSYPSYHYTPGSTINILSAGISTPNVTSIFGQFTFQNFGISDLWEVTKSEEEEKKETEDQEFTYQNPITENPEFETLNLRNQQNLNSVNSEVETPNIQTLPTQNNQNPNLINQSNLPLQPLQLLPQQNQQPLQQPPQPPNLDPMAYAPIAKLDNFTSEENNAQNNARAMQAIPYFLKDTADLWYQSLINKPQDFNAFKVEFLRYFSNNNSINYLVNTFTTIKQGETEAIQAIDANYFTALQILNQFIHGLCSSILQHVCSLHPGTLQDAVTCARDFKLAEFEANHTQAVNLVMNRSSKLDSKLKQFSDSINQKLEGYLADNHAIYQPPQQRPISSGSQKSMFATTVKPRSPISNSKISTKSGTISKHLPANDTTANLPSTSISDSSLLTAATSDISTAATHNISTAATKSRSRNSSTSATQNPNSQNYLSLLVIPEDATTNNSGSNQQQTLTNNIPPATVTNDKLLAAIFPFDLEETIKILLFSGAALEEKPITAMYTDVKIDGHTIKLILNSGLAGSIITRQLMNQLGHRVDRAASARIITANGAIKTPIGKIDNLPIEINGIMVPVKVFVMEVTQYQALGKRKEKEEGTTLTSSTYSLDTYTSSPPTNYCQPKLECINCGKKLLSMGACCGNDEEYSTATRFYCHPCVIERFGQPKQQEKTILSNEGMWNDIPGHGGMCNETYKLWRMVYAKAEDVTTSELLEIKNNPLSLPEPEYVQTFDVFGNIEDNLEEFHEHYQHLALTREEQEQHLKQLNTRLC